jgi:predicted transcriptional regulator
MSQILSIELSEQVARQVQEVAARTQRPVETILAEWIGHFVEDLPVEWLSDEDVLAVANQVMSEAEDSELSDLLAQQREDTLNASGKIHLEELMAIYRRGLVRKAEAIKTAVKRGLLPPLNEWDDNPLKLPQPVKR